MVSTLDMHIVEVGDPKLEELIALLRFSICPSLFNVDKVIDFSQSYTACSVVYVYITIFFLFSQP